VAFVDIRLLGDTELRINDQPVDIGHARQRSVLVVLLIEANRTVTVSQLVERVWGTQRLPARPAKVLQSYVALLRRALSVVDGLALNRRQSGYQLTVDRESIDMHRFLDLVKRGHLADDDRSASNAMEQALALWRGEPFADLTTPWCQAIRASLAQKHQTAQLDLADIRLRAGRHAELLAELTNWARLRPQDERLAGQLMVALYRSGRQADALRHYEHIRKHLAADLGTDPGPALQRLYRQILTTDAALITAPAPPRPSAHFVVPRELPADVPYFTGRAPELASLDRILADGEQPRTAMISGIPGVGKSALAVHWAHRCAYLFPDGQLYVDLQSGDQRESALRPVNALHRFLEALDVPPARVPADLSAAVGLYRSILADRRMLVVVDNAADAEQVRPLLPGTSACRTLITSRDQMPGLVATNGVDLIDLHPCSSAEATELVSSRIGPERAGIEPATVKEIAGYCAGLPLALVNVAAQASTRPNISLYTLVRELRENRHQLDALASDDPALDLRTAFASSYRTLSPAAARLFRLIALHPGPEIDTGSLAVLADVSDAGARPALAELARAHLITECGRAQWTCHPLLRAYAAEQLHETETEPQCRDAVRRMHDQQLDDGGVVTSAGRQ
jgi:DNA-binding SARP family transcriptional activator